jgi:hypothetical protein
MIVMINRKKVATQLRGKGKHVRVTRPKDRLLPYYEVWIR